MRILFLRIPKFFWPRQSVSFVVSLPVNACLLTCASDDEADDADDAAQPK